MLNDDAYDTENMDPASMLSPSKKIKTFDFTPTKPASKFVLHDATPKPAPVPSTLEQGDAAVANRRAARVTNGSRGGGTRKRSVVAGA